jgi:RNA polymerase sigma-70 factor (ECF subfamily)
VKLIRGDTSLDSAAAEELFDALYREYYHAVRAYVLRRATAELAADVVADTFLVVWRRMDRLPPEPLPWLLGVARKTLANSQRAARRRERLFDRLRAHQRPQSHSDAQAGDWRTTAIGEALERLPERDQELLKLIAWDGLTVAEAAMVLGQSAANCRMRLHRARRRLTSALAPCAEVPRLCNVDPPARAAKEESR